MATTTADEPTTATQLEIKIIHANHLWAFNFFQKLCVYAAVSLSSDADNRRHLPKGQMQEQRTAVDSDGDGHPEWNHPMTFHLSLPNLPPLSELFLRFELRHHAGLIFPDRTIGEVRVPLSDLLEAADNFRFVDYQVRSPDGKPNGELRFAYKLNRDLSDGLGFSISGYPRIFDQDRPPEKPPSNLYPADSPETTSPPSPLPSVQPHLPPDSSPQPPPQYPAPPPPMWPPPPPPPPPQHPPYWAPPVFMGHPSRPPPPSPHHPPPPPPPGYGHPSWGYHLQTERQSYNGSWERRV